MTDKAVLRQLARSLSRAGVMPTTHARLPRGSRNESKTSEPEAKPFIYGEASDNWDPTYQPVFQKLKEDNLRKELEQKAQEPPKSRVIPNPVPPEPKEDPQEWGPKVREKKKQQKEKIKYAPDVETLIVRKRIPAQKSRNQSMTISVSAEEIVIIREYLASIGNNFSSWARELMFREMRKEIPRRVRLD